jgi:energy-coupling factor transporter ATP-binding protein EcfA2
MYNEYFGFTESPFNVTSDPRFFYSNRHYQEAFTGLRWGIKLRQGLIMTGEAGTGKTTLLRIVTEKFEPNISSALILGPYPDFSAVLQLMLIEFGLPKPPAICAARGRTDCSLFEGNSQIDQYHLRYGVVCGLPGWSKKYLAGNDPQDFL